MRFYCHCLNVNIDVLDVSDDQETLSQILPVDLVQSVHTYHEWFLCNVPSDHSVHTGWNSLLQILPIRDMKLNRCLGCNLYTHVTNFAPSKMLINKDLLDDTTVSEVYHDPSYSKIAKIVLPAGFSSSNMTRSSASQDENIQRECELAQQVFRQSIEDLERETEEKIRMFQREQEQALETKRESLGKELETFLSLMRAVARHPATKGSPTLQTSSSYINENSTESGLGSDIFDVGATDYSRAIERTFSERTTNLDEETNDDPMLDNRNWFSNDHGNFATSVPRDIVFRPTNVYNISQRNNEDIDDLERIGKSFRDLSRSMCTDGTEVFGDLPSPRLNSRRT